MQSDRLLCSDQKTGNFPIYAIGDVHGELSFLKEILLKIYNHAQTEGNSKPKVIFLGDLIDRGLKSCLIIDLLISDRFKRLFDAEFLMGNHESWLLGIVEQNFDSLDWLKHGGAETVESYGIVFGGETSQKTVNNFIKKLPASHLDFFKKMKLYHLEQNYLFVHAGINPLKPLDQQNETSLLWSSNALLSFKEDLEFQVVHGHVAFEQVQIKSNRISVDTGSGYPGGQLSSVALYDNKHVHVFNAKKISDQNKQISNEQTVDKLFDLLLESENIKPNLKI